MPPAEEERCSYFLLDCISTSRGPYYFPKPYWEELVRLGAHCYRVSGKRSHEYPRLLNETYLFFVARKYGWTVTLLSLEEVRLLIAQEQLRAVVNPGR